jgi:hypothetical protein
MKWADDHEWLRGREIDVGDPGGIPKDRIGGGGGDSSQDGQ